MNDLGLLPAHLAPTPSRPMLGLTVLVVEDSRFASEAMRLLCLRSGARIRRADCLASARRHLATYRPTVIVVDLGLPDGSGLDLIAEIDRATPRVAVLLATSGDADRAEAAVQAGADGFLPKPVANLGMFQDAVLSRLPPDRVPPGPRRVQTEPLMPDRVAFDDDMQHAAEVMALSEDGKTTDYVARFLTGVARIAEDSDLLDAADHLVTQRRHGQPDRVAVARVAGLVQQRLSQRRAI